MGFADNFLPDSVDKSSGILSVTPSGEVSLNYTGNHNCKVIFALLPLPSTHSAGHEQLEGFMRSAQALIAPKTRRGIFQGVRTFSFTVPWRSGLNGNPTLHYITDLMFFTLILCTSSSIICLFCSGCSPTVMIIFIRVIKLEPKISNTSWSWIGKPK